MKNFKKSATRIEKFIVFLSLLFALIIVAEMTLVLFGRFLGLISDQIIIGQYTLAVTIVLAVAALAGGGTIWMASYFRREMDQQRKDIETIASKARSFYGETMNSYKNIVEGRQLIEEELIKLRRIYLPEWEAGLDLARDVKHASEKLKHTVCKQCLAELARIFEKHSTLKTHAIRIFTATESHEVKSSAMALFNMAPEWGRRLIESRLNFEKASTSPNLELVEFLSRLLGLGMKIQ